MRSRRGLAEGPEGGFKGDPEGGYLEGGPEGGAEGGSRRGAMLKAVRKGTKKVKLRKEKSLGYTVKSYILYRP